MLNNNCVVTLYILFDHLICSLTDRPIEKYLYIINERNFYKKNMFQTKICNYGVASLPLNIAFRKNGIEGEKETTFKNLTKKTFLPFYKKHTC